MKPTLKLAAPILGFAVSLLAQQPANTSPKENATKQPHSALFTAEANNPPDQTVRIWDAQTGKQVTNALAAFFSPDGRLIVTNADKSVQIWDVQTGKPLTHLGAWQLVSFKYRDTDKWSDVPPGERRIKFITETRFTWTDYDTATGKVKSMAGGSYTLSGLSYTETIEYAGEGMADYLSKKQSFTIQLEQDKLHQSGQLSDGTKIEEVWQRVK